MIRDAKNPCGMIILIFVVFAFGFVANLWASESKSNNYHKKAIFLVPSQVSYGSKAFVFDNYRVAIKSLEDCGCYVEFDTAKSFEDAKQILESKTPRTIDILVIGGHGTSSSIEFGSSALTIKSTIEENTFKLINKTGFIVLDACLTGSCGELAMGIAKYISRKSGVPVFAPATSVSSLHFTQTAERVLPKFSLFGIAVPTRSFKGYKVQYSDYMSAEQRIVAFNDCKLFDLVESRCYREVSSLIKSCEFSGFGLALALMKAVSMGCLNVYLVLIEAKADVGKVIEEGALITAAHEGHAYMVKLLLKDNADVNQVVIGGRTAISRAAYRGHVEVVRILVEAKADIGHLDCQGSTAREIALSNGHSEVVKILDDAESKGNGGCCCWFL